MLIMMMMMAACYCLVVFHFLSDPLLLPNKDLLIIVPAENPNKPELQVREIFQTFSCIQCL